MSSSQRTCCDFCNICSRIVCCRRKAKTNEKYDRMENDYNFEKKKENIFVNVYDNLNDCKGTEAGLVSRKMVTSREAAEGLSESKGQNNILPEVIPGRESPTIGHTFEQKPEFTVKRKFKSKYPRVPHLCILGDSLWFSSGKSTTLQKVQFDDIYLKEKLTLKIRVHGLAVTSSNNILIVTSESRLMQIDGTTGDLTYSKYNVAPLVPTAVHVTSSGNVLVAVTESVPNFPPTGRRALLEMNEAGDTETIYEYEKDNKRLFTYPCRITSAKNSIVVVDRLTEDKTGQVIILGTDGIVRHKYTGQRIPFRPVYTVTTPMDNILIAERDRSQLHILDSMGKLKGRINLLNYGITHPLSLVYDTKGQLYIGTARSKRSPQRPSTIYQTEIVGC